MRNFIFGIKGSFEKFFNKQSLGDQIRDLKATKNYKKIYNLIFHESIAIEPVLLSLAETQSGYENETLKTDTDSGFQKKAVIYGYQCQTRKIANIECATNHSHSQDYKGCNLKKI